MVEDVVKSGLETYLLGIPLIALLLIGVFRLDELILKPKNKPRRQPPPPRGVDEEGREIQMASRSVAAEGTKAAS
jgi:hypothetical protein